MSFEVIHDTNALLNSIKSKGKNVVIFDIFDTIIHRKIYPEDVKKISCSKLIDFLQLHVPDVDTLYNARAAIEKDICMNNLAIGKDAEFSFSHFARLFFEHIQNTYSADLSESDFIDLLEKIEISAELGCQHIDHSIKNTIEKLKMLGNKVICCSDFYLEARLVRELLGYHGLAFSEDEIIVSSEYLLTKRSGRLFGIVAEKYQPGRCLMIGDNLESDCRQAVANGFDCIHLDRSFFHEYYAGAPARFGEQIFKTNVQRILDHNSNILFPELALSAFYFVKNLYFSAWKKGYRDVFFLAREGQLLEELFNLFQDSFVVNPRLKIKTHYLKVSRRSTFIPGLSKLYKEDFHTLFRQYVHISYAEFMHSLGFDQGFIDHMASLLNLDKSKREKDFPRSEAYARLVTHDEFITAFESRRLSQKKYFREYVKQFEPADPNRLAIIDVGWKGTIQDNLKKIFGEEVSIEGFYLGLVIDVDNADTSNLKHGLLFSKNMHDKFSAIFDENRSLFEVVFAANHGSAIEYIKNEDQSVGVNQEDFSQEINFYKQSVLPVINHQRKLFELICREYGRHPIADSSLYHLAAQHHARLVFRPTQHELSWFLGLYHVENFGVFQRNIFSQTFKGKKWIRRIETYIDYQRNPGRYTQNVMWPSAELMKYGLKKKQLKYAKQKHKSIFGV